MSFSVCVWRHRRWSLIGSVAIGVLLVSLPARAAVFSEVLGTADAATVSGPAPSDFYGPVLSTDGNVASAFAADQTGLLQSSAQSLALANVSSSTQGSATFGSSSGNSSAAWSGVFTNDTGVGAEFVLTAAWTRDVATDTQPPVDVFVPDFFPGNVDPLATATLAGSLIIGATPVSFDALATGIYQFNVGFIPAGGTLALQLSVGTSASIDAGSMYACTSIDPGPDDCTFRPGTADAFAAGTLAIANLTPVPEPGAGLILLGGLSALGLLVRRRMREGMRQPSIRA